MKKTAKKPSKIAKKQPKNSARVQSKFDALTRAFACAEFAADGRCSWSNEAFQRAFGYGAEELAGKHQRDLSGSFPPPAWETALASGLVSGEFQFAKKDGSPVWLSGSLSRVGEGKSASVLAIVADSSAAHVARHELELKSLRTQASIDGATTCLMQANERFEIISMNDSLVAMLRKNEAAIQKQMAHFRVDGIIGMSMDRFHKEPGHQHRMLGGLHGRHTVKLNLGGRLFSLTATASRDAHDTVVGYSVEWADITEQTDAAARLAALSSVQATVEFSPEGRVLTANQRFLDLFGYSLDEIKDQPDRFFCDAAAATSAEYQAIWSRVAQGESYAGTVQRLGKAGRALWLESSYTPIRDAAGKLLKVVQFSVDVTAKQNAAVDFEGKLRAIDRAQGMIEFGLDGMVLTANSNFLNVLGYTLEEVRGQHHRMFCEPAFVASHEHTAFWQKLNRGEYEAALHKRIGKGGKEVWIQASYNPVFDANGKPFKVVKFATDVTQKELAAAEQNGRMKAVDRAQAIIEFGMDGRVLHANQNFLNVIGYTLEEVRGQHHKLFCDPAYVATQEYSAFWQKLNRGEFDAALYKRKAKGGKDVWIQATYNPIFDLNGKPYKVVKFATDVTAEQSQLVEMEKLVAKLVALATNGDLSGRLATAGLTGIMATLATSVNTLMDAVAKPIAEVKRVAVSLASGELSSEVSGAFAGDFAELQNSFNESIRSIRGVVEKIQHSTQAMQSATQDISQGNNNLSQRTQEQSSALEETASSLEEMTSTVKQNAGNATQANQLAASARSAAERGGSVVASAIEAMQAITESSKKVADIIGVIEQLAFQTNMLALNAAVEAARAGDQGRGFAVVAAEVRNLAQRSAAAAKEIKVLLQTSADRVGQGATLVNNSGEALKEIVLGVKKVSDIIAEINVASDEQASGISQINQAVTSMDKMTQQNAALVEEAATAADSMNEQARGLIEVVGFFKLGGASKPVLQSRPQQARGSVVEPALEVGHAVAPAPASAPRPTKPQAQDPVWESF